MDFDDRPDPAKRLEKARLARLFETARAAVDYFGWNYDTYIQHERGERGLTRAAVKYGKAFKVSPAWLLTGEGQGPDGAGTVLQEEIAEPELPRPSGGFPINPHEIPRRGDALMPVLGLAIGGDDGRFYFNGETVGWTRVPAQLENIANAYGLYVAGDSMVPRYKPGEVVHVNPYKPPVPGKDDVIVQLKPIGDEQPEGFIKEFRGYRGNRLVLWQHNPPQEIEFPRQLVLSVHTIVGRD
jgi:phage repressor protein C with HTH and peptisase S24 domain